MNPNVRRYVALPQHRGGTCFCRLTVMLGYIHRLQNYRVGKNRDTMRESPVGAGAGRTVDHLTVLFSQNPDSYRDLAVRRGNDIYRPVSKSCH